MLWDVDGVVLDPLPVLLYLFTALEDNRYLRYVPIKSNVPTLLKAPTLASYPTQTSPFDELGLPCRRPRLPNYITVTITCVHPPHFS